jgi:hypothetical protein
MKYSEKEDKPSCAEITVPKLLRVCVQGAFNDLINI